MRLVFFGTSEFAVPILETLARAEFEIVLVITQPDKRQGRKLNLSPSPVAATAEILKLPILKPEKISAAEFQTTLRALCADAGVVAAYGKLIPESLITIFPKGILNVHPSLLPELRGSSPVPYAILEGKSETGVTIMLLDKELDHGPIIAQIREEIKPIDTSATLTERLAKLGAKLLADTLPKWARNEIKAQTQNHAQATFTRHIEKSDGRIDWRESAEIIRRKIRAYAPWPGTFTFIYFNGASKFIKIVRAEIIKIDNRAEHEPGEFFITSNSRPAVATGLGALELMEVQPESGKIISGKSFLNGYRHLLGKRFS